MGSATTRWLILLALASSSASGQTVPQSFPAALASEGTRSHHLRVDTTSLSAMQPFRPENSLPLEQACPRYPDLSGLRPNLSQLLFAATAGRRAAVRPANAQSNSISCVAPCKPVLPFHEPPIDADGVLARCNNLLSPVVSILHSLSANQR